MYNETKSNPSPNLISPETKLEMKTKISNFIQLKWILINLFN